jgi:hypothetical protein
MSVNLLNIKPLFDSAFLERTGVTAHHCSVVIDAKCQQFELLNCCASCGTRMFCACVCGGGGGGRRVCGCNVISGSGVRWVVQELRQAFRRVHLNDVPWPVRCEPLTISHAVAAFPSNPAFPYPISS